MTTRLLGGTLIFLVALGVTGCLKVGTNVGSNIITLNASILKGRLRQAQVSVLDAQGQLVWEGFSDDLGQANIELRGASVGEWRILAQPIAGASMLCDATKCALPVQEAGDEMADESTRQKIAFGGTIPLNGNEALRLTTRFHSESLSADSQVLQVSGLSQITAEWLALAAPQEYQQSALQHQRYSRLASQLITTSLGLALSNELNLLSARLVDLNQSLDLRRESASNSLLSLINASLSSDFRLVSAYSDALENLAQDPSNPSIQAEFEALQKRILRETQKLTQLPGITGLDVSVIDQINAAANNELDFSGINQAMENTRTGNTPSPQPVGPSVMAIQASSAHWRPTPTNLRENAWWWVSRSDSVNNEWIQFEFAQPVTPSVMLFAIDKDRGGNNLALQARNPGDPVWTNLELSLSDIAFSQGETDDKNVLHVRYVFSQAQQDLGAFQRFRLLSAPTNSLWLEYWCLGEIEPAHTCVSGQPLAVQTVSVSSLWFDAANVGVANASWISRMASGQPEWLQLTYSDPIVAKSIKLTAKAEFLGAQPQIQARNTNGQWQTLLQLNIEQLRSNSEEDGVVRVELPIAPEQAYTEYRYYSQPTTFVWIQQFELTM